MATSAPASVEMSRGIVSQEVPAGALSASVPIARAAIALAQPGHTSSTASAAEINNGSNVITASNKSPERVTSGHWPGRPLSAYGSRVIYR